MYLVYNIIASLGIFPETIISEVFKKAFFAKKFVLLTYNFLCACKQVHVYSTCVIFCIGLEYICMAMYAEHLRSTPNTFENTDQQLQLEKNMR